METHGTESRCHRSGTYAVCRLVPASFSPEILQAGAVKGLMYFFQTRFTRFWSPGAGGFRCVLGRRLESPHSTRTFNNFTEGAASSILRGRFGRHRNQLWHSSISAALSTE